MSDDETTQTLEQLRAEDALGAVRDVEDESADFQDTYRQQVRGLAARIVDSGLGQTCATLLSDSDGGDAYEALYEALTDWLTSSSYESPYSDREDVLEQMTSGDQSDYLHAHTEALAWLSWTKKFAQAFLADSNQ